MELSKTGRERGGWKKGDLGQGVQDIVRQENQQLKTIRWLDLALSGLGPTPSRNQAASQVSMLQAYKMPPCWAARWSRSTLSRVSVLPAVRGKSRERRSHRSPLPQRALFSGGRRGGQRWLHSGRGKVRNSRSSWKWQLCTRVPGHCRDPGTQPPSPSVTLCELDFNYSPDSSRRHQGLSCERLLAPSLSSCP